MKKNIRISQTAKASIAFAACSIMQKAIQFITIPLFTRLLTTEQYGQFTLYQSWFGIISIFATLNLSYGVFNNGMLKYKDNRDQYISVMQGLSTTATIVVTIVYLLFNSWIHKVIELPQCVIYVMLLELLFSPALSFWSARQRFEYKYIALVTITLLVSLVSPIVGLVAVKYSQDKGIARIVSFAIVNALIGLIFYIFNTIRGKKFFVKEYWGFAIKFNLPLIPHYLSMIALSQLGRILVSKYCGETEVAILGLSSSIAMVMNIVISSINASLVPWTYQKCEELKFSDIRKYSNYLLVFMAVISLVPVILAPEVIIIMAPREYISGVTLIGPTAISIFFMFLYSLFCNVEFYYAESKFVMVASVSAAILNITLNIYAIPRFGYQSSAYVTGICYVMLSVAHYIFMKQVCKKHKVGESIYNIKFISLLSILVVVISAVIMMTYQYLWLRYGLVLLIILLTFINRKKVLNIINGLKQRKE